VYLQNMDRSLRQRAKEGATPPPPSSRLTFNPKRNRKKPMRIWANVPRPAAIADACGRALRRAVPALIGAGVLAAVSGTAVAGYHFVTTSPRFAITYIEVHGNHRVTAEHVLALVPAHLGDNVFAADLDAATRALHSDPWIANATVSRMLPHTLVLEIAEYQPAAVADFGAPYLVDRDGHAFKRVAVDTGEDTGLPLITGLDRATYLGEQTRVTGLIRGALATLAAWRNGGDTRPPIGEVHLDARGALTLRTADRATEIELGVPDQGLPTRMHMFDAVWAALDDAERASARTLHLDTRSDHVTVAFR
jgi:cell division protein FtsQ